MIFTNLKSGRFVLERLIDGQKAVESCVDIHTSFQLHASVWVEQPHVITADVSAGDTGRVTPGDVGAVALNFIRGTQKFTICMYMWCGNYCS